MRPRIRKRAEFRCHSRWPATGRATIVVQLHVVLHAAGMTEEPADVGDHRWGGGRRVNPGAGVSCGGVRAGLDEDIGILCLSRNGASLPMWAHYAASYSGALIEFKEAHEFFSGAIDVEYCTHRPKLKLGSYNERVNGPVPIAELCVKSKEWEYEREVRIIRSLTDCRMVSRRRHDAAYPIYVQELPPDGIASVVLGERTSTDDQREIVSLLAGGDIRLYLDAVSNWDYDLRREPILLGPGLGPLISPRTAPIFSHLDSTHGEIARWQLKNSRFAHMTKDPL